jgi:hypothetical protein
VVKGSIEKLLDDVKSTRDKCSKKGNVICSVFESEPCLMVLIRIALKTVWTLNLAVGLQVTLGALTTGFAAIIKGDRVYFDSSCNITSCFSYAFIRQDILDHCTNRLAS